MPSVEGVRISELPQATTVDESDVLAGVQYGTTKRFSMARILEWIKEHIGLTAGDVGAVDANDVGVPGGVAALDSNGKVPEGELPFTLDNTPTENSTNPVKSGGVYSDVRTRVPKFGKGVNLLRNWYFVGGGTGRGVFPVNQRGQSSYSGATFVFDGWAADANTSITFGSAGITVSILSGSSTNIYQRAGKAPLGQSITMSILTGNGLVSVSGVMPSTLPSSNQTVLTVGTSTDGYRFRLYLQPAGTMYVEFRAYSTQTWVATKLELGSEQTLAHQENGTWVLNEIPDYEEELIKCQTSTADSADTYANKSLATEQQLAYVETGTTTSRVYAVGEYFCWNGLLYRVKTAISSGDTFTPGTNCVQTTLASQIKLSTATLTTNSGGTVSTGLNVSTGKILAAFATGYDISVYLNSSGVQGYFVKTAGTNTPASSVTISVTAVILNY